MNLRVLPLLMVAALSLPAHAVTYNFVQTGFAGGGVLSGSFTANDLDHDGWIYGLEVSAFSMSFSGNAEFAAFSHTKANFNGIGYKVGDTVIGGHEESYLQTSSSKNGRFINYDAFGWPEFTIPGRLTEDPAGKVLTSSQLIQVTAVPEPGGWALLLGGLGAVGRVVRRRAG